MAAAIAAQQALQAQAAEQAAATAQQEEITVIARPPGEAGSRTRGFNLQEVMGLDENRALYQAILVMLLLSRLSSPNSDVFHPLLA